MKKEKIIAVPTNIITGFLGVGKTSAILQLLQNKPKAERWAVLVNEFGEIGVDGSLLGGLHGQEQGVYIREVPGGCMCCAAGLPMQVALNQLLAQARPDRLLIEPTGLGHPKEVLQVLSSGPFRETLSIEKILTLVDARKISQSRYTTHETFLQQIAIADVIVANKQDLYGQQERLELQKFVEQNTAPGTAIVFTEQGRLQGVLLQGLSRTLEQGKPSHHHHGKSEEQSMNERKLPSEGYLSAENEGEGFQSVGWRISPYKVFDRNLLKELLSTLKVERMKAVFITAEGVFGYNMAEDDLREVALDDCLESRIEIIAEKVDPAWQQRILNCIAYEHPGNEN